MSDHLSLLVTSYGVYDAIHEVASPELGGWLDAHVKKWKVQAKWDLPLADVALLNQLTLAILQVLTASKGRRVKTVQTLLDKLNEGRGIVVTTKPTAAEVVADLAESTPNPALKAVADTLVQAKQDSLKEMLTQVPADVPAEAVAVVEEALAASGAPPTVILPAAPEKPAQPAHAPMAPMAALVSSSAAVTPMRRLEPEGSPLIPPPEKRAAALLGALFRRIKSE